MASTKNHQLATQIFSHQPNGEGAAALDASVGQDNGRISSARQGTVQPAPHTIPSRPQPARTGAARSKDNPSPKRKTVHLTLWVDPIVKRELQRLAQQEGLTVSKTGAAFLEQALQNNIDMHYSALLEPIIRQEIQTQMQAISNRLAFLLARNAFTSEQTRSLATNILGRQSGMTEETLKTILAMTKRIAKGNLTRRNPELEKLIAAMKQWLDSDETEPANEYL